MIWWRGRGIWVLFIVGGTVLASQVAYGALLPTAFPERGDLPIGASLLLSGLACYPLGEFTRKRKFQVEDGEAALDFGHHSLFFIPVHIFPYLLGILGLALWVKEIAGR